jgi:hypothetical protein
LLKGKQNRMSEITHPQLPPNPLSVQLEEMGHKAFAKAVENGEIPSLTGKLLDSVRYELIEQQIQYIPEDEMSEISVPVRDDKGAIQRDANGYAKSEKKSIFKRDQRLKVLLVEQGLTLQDWERWEKRKNNVKSRKNTQ